MPTKRFPNNPNHEYIVDEEGNLLSREIAKKYIYDKNKGIYQKPFSYYVVHHIDGDTFNNSIKNLYICTREHHRKIHQEQKRRRKKFKSNKEINNFFENYREKGQTTIPSKKEYYFEPKFPSAWEPTPINPIEIFPEQKNNVPIGKIIITLLIIFGLIYFLNIYGFKDKSQEEILPISIKNETNQIPQEKIEPIIIRGDKNAFYVENNLPRDISLNITYKIYSNWFGANYESNGIFDVEANTTKEFIVYRNDGCDTHDCSVSVINYEEI